MIKPILEIFRMLSEYWAFTYNETYQELEAKYKSNNDPNNPNSPTSWFGSSDGGSCGGGDD